MDNSPLIYILDAKIQRQRLKDMKEAAKRRKIKTTDTFSSSVTHIVTEFKEIGSLLRKLNKSNLDELGEVNIVSVEWFTDCMKAGKTVSVQDKHRIQTTSSQPSSSTNTGNESTNVYHMAEYACQRATPLKHFNKKLTDALEVLELHAELREGEHDYSRALAFRRASCVLKCLPFPLIAVHQLRKVTNIGDHSRRVIQEILEDGSSTEVEDILQNPWFHKMKLFSGIFGIGPAKAKQFVDNGWSSIQEAQEGFSSADKRVQWGLAFHEDLATPVCQKEAGFILKEVQRHVDRILPGAILQLTGGFRRGKATGHDVDILITHPTIGKEVGVLPRLLSSLQSHDIILYGQYEKCTYTDVVLSKDFKLSMKGQLDHFEKWLGIFKVPNAVSEQQNEEDKVIYRRDTNGGNTDRMHEEETGDLNHPDKGTTQDMKTASNKEIPKEIEIANNAGHGDLNGSLDDADSRYKQDKLSNSDIISMSKEPRTWTARRVDLIISPYDQYFYAVVGWTGNKMFNRDLRWYAKKEHGMKLTSHGLYDSNKGRKVPASSEAEVFEHLQIPYREPRDRNC